MEISHLLFYNECPLARTTLRDAPISRGLKSVIFQVSKTGELAVDELRFRILKN